MALATETSGLTLRKVPLTWGETCRETVSTLRLRPPRETFRSRGLTASHLSGRVNTKAPNRSRGPGSLTSAMKVSCMQDTIHRRIALVLLHGPMSARDLSEAIGKSYGSVRKILSRHPDMFRREGSHWVLHGNVPGRQGSKSEWPMTSQKQRDIRRRGINVISAAEAINNHDGRCDICQTTWPGGNGWALDHDHDLEPEAPVRGVLCTNCNTGLGMFGDSPSRLIEASQYLLRANR